MEEINELESLLKAVELSSDADSATALGDVYYSGEGSGGVPDYDKAFYYYSIGAAGGNARSRYKLADMFLNGYAVGKNLQTASKLIRDVYNEELMKILREDVACDFADAALRAGNLCRDGICCDANPKDAFYYYLQALYAVHMRAFDGAFYNDRQMLADIEQRILEVLPQTGYEKPVGTVHYAGMDELLQYALRKGRPMEMKFKRSAGNSARLTFRIVSGKEETVKPKIFVTVPEASFVGHLSQLSIKARKIEHIDWPANRDTILFDNIIGPYFFQGSMRKATLEADYVFSVPRRK